MSRPFLKMNGLGNDFVVVEARTAPFAPSAEEVRAIASRERGIGCDQLVSIEPSGKADAKVRFWNADGDEVGACGNASRCVGWLLMEASGADRDDDGSVVGTVTGIDHKRLFSDPEDGSSLWSLAVDPSAGLPGVAAAVGAVPSTEYLI